MTRTPSKGPASRDGTCSTLEAAEMLSMAVRSVQMMVDRGDLQAWKTPGGHRRIALASVQKWLAERGLTPSGAAPTQAAAGGDFGRIAAERRAKPASAATVATRRSQEPSAGLAAASAPARPSGQTLRILLIEDSSYFQNLVSLLVKRHWPEAELHVADDGIGGLAMAGQLRPDVLLVDILLPGIDGAALITSLRSHPQFQDSELVVVTSLDESQRAPFAFALEGVPVVHKTQLVQALPTLLGQAVERARAKRVDRPMLTTARA